MLIHRTSAQRGKHISSQKLLAKILHDHLARARRISLLDNGFNVISLADIADHRDHAVGVIFFEPRNNNGGIEPPGVSEYNFFRHEHSSRAGDRRRPTANKESLSAHAGDFLPAQRPRTAANRSPRRLLPTLDAPAGNA